MLKKITVLLVLCVSSSVTAQDTLFLETFENASTGFTLNSSDLGAATTNNLWTVNNSYTGGSGSLVCLSFPFSYTVSNTPSQPTAISFSNGQYMHIMSQEAASDGITCASYSSADGICVFAETNFSHMTSDISTLGASNVVFSFWWICAGSADAYGEVYYSTNAGTSWNQLTGTTYNSQSSWIQNTISNPMFDNQTSLRFAFRFVNNTATAATDPSFSVDDVVITGTTCSSTSASINETTCDTYTSPSGQFTWSTSGTYQDTISNVAGCDSIITINLTNGALDTSITLNNFTLTAAGAASTYQWVDCNNGFGAITGATSASFTATSNGSYAAILNNGVCLDTTACVNVIGVGIGDMAFEDLSVSPNPSNGVFLIQRSGTQLMFVEISDYSGRTVKEQYTSSTSTNIDLTNYPKGLYIMNLSTDKAFISKRILIQ